MPAKNYLVIGPPSSGKEEFVESQIDSSSVIIRLDPRMMDNRKSVSVLYKSILRKDYKISDDIHVTFKKLRASMMSCKEKYTVVITHLESYVESPDNQHFLYQLFDLSHDARADITTYAISSVPFVLDLFEKRVKSRFAHTLILREAPMIDDHVQHTRKLLDELYPGHELDDRAIENLAAYKTSREAITTLIEKANLLDMSLKSLIESESLDSTIASLRRLPRYQLALLAAIHRFLRTNEKISFSQAELYKLSSLCKSNQEDPIKLDKMPIHILDGWICQLVENGLLNEYRRKNAPGASYKQVLRQEVFYTYIKSTKENWLNSFLN